MSQSGKPFQTATIPQASGYRLSWPGENRAVPPGGARWGWRRQMQPFNRGRLQPVGQPKNAGWPVALLPSE